MKVHRIVFLTVLTFFLTACDVDLYRSLPEDEANQMLALLMQHHIDAEKKQEEDGVTLRVEQSQFINAVELLRLNGYPHRQFTTADKMFPANQLVVSPQEEQQKINFLKEQRIEGMLSQMEGVINAKVTIALPTYDEGSNREGGEVVDEIPLSVDVIVDRTVIRSGHPDRLFLPETPFLSRPDPEVLQLYRYFWQPARYAVPEWLDKLGFHLSNCWRYGDRPELDRLLDRALNRLRGSSVIPACLNDRQKRQVRLAPRISAFAFGLGLFKLRCSDYFMLPEYRQLLLQWFSEDEIWQLYGWLGQRDGKLLPPQVMQQTALQIGTAILNREAHDDAVLHALLVLLPPPQRILWPKTSLTEIIFMEHLL